MVMHWFLRYAKELKYYFIAPMPSDFLGLETLGDAYLGTILPEAERNFDTANLFPIF